MGRKIRKVVYVEEEDEPPLAKRSLLDRIGYGLVFLIFLAPGKWLLAFDSWGSRRYGEKYINDFRRDNKAWQIFKSLAFWAVIVVVVLYFKNVGKAHN